MVSKDDIQVDPKKIEAIMEWSRPITDTKIRSFLGLASYYRRFMKDFSKIATPLTRLNQKNAKFVWTDKCEEHFQMLKDILISVLELTLPLGYEGYIVYCYAS